MSHNHKITYNKLVRDRIPEIIEADGKKCEFEVLSQEQYIIMLETKLSEELAEYQESKSLEELADLLEVMKALVEARGYTWEDLSSLRKEKLLERGGFSGRILLKTVFDPFEDDSLSARISRNKEAILEKIDLQTLDKYCWIQENVHERDVSTDGEFQGKFINFYSMRYVSNRFRNAFFVLFEKIKTNPDVSFEDVARRLYAIDGKHQFSFITKMLHTINPKRPIFDSQVNDALRLRSYQPDFEKKLKRDNEILSEISDQYGLLVGVAAVKDILTELDRRTCPRMITNEKKIDFILWALGAKN